MELFYLLGYVEWFFYCVLFGGVVCVVVGNVVLYFVVEGLGGGEVGYFFFGGSGVVFSKGVFVVVGVVSYVN